MQQREAGEAVYLIRAAESHDWLISAALEVAHHFSVVSGVTCKSVATESCNDFSFNRLK